MGRLHDVLKKADQEKRKPRHDVDADLNKGVSDTINTPLSETETAPLSETEVAPLSETEAAPLSETEVAPLSETEAAPLSETEVAPLSETEAAPLSETEAAPLSETEAAPLSEKEAAPLSETEAAPLSETEAAPLSETEAAPLSETEAAPLSETEAAPLSRALVVTTPRSETATTSLFNRRPSYEYQAIKTKIITRFPNNAIKTIMVTGTSRQCGTTTTAVGFATTLASDCKSRVLLVEANTRLPSFNKFFTLKEGIGLSDLFSASPEEILPLQAAVSGNLLYVIPSGERKTGANTFFESDRFDDILDKFRSAFDYVILDAPPVISHDEPKILGKKVDGVILVSRSGKSRQRVAIRAKNELESSGANILGVVLNRRKHYIPEWLYNRL